VDVTESMQIEAKALADPSRFQLFRFIVESDVPVVVSDLTELLGFNHNAIRQHLAVLVEAGLITESDETGRKTRGRPRKQYQLRSDALGSFGSVSGSYQRLAALLLDVLRSGESPFDVGFRAGMHEAASGGDVRVEGLVGQLMVEGFEPKVTQAGDIELGNCPYADLATTDAAIVCELHRGLIQGHLGAGGQAVGVTLQPRDPRKAKCLVGVDQSAVE